MTEDINDPFSKGLEDLGTIPDRSTIEGLAMLAEDALGDPSNVSTLCGVLLRRISTVESQRKVPLLYLLDFISKNLGPEFQTGFAPMLASVIVSAYHTVSPENQASMRRMMLTWRDQNLYIAQLSEISANVGGLGFDITPQTAFSIGAGTTSDGMNPAKRQRVDPSMPQMHHYVLPGQTQPGQMMMMGYPQQQFIYGQQMIMPPYGGMPISNPQMPFFQQQQQQQQQLQMHQQMQLQQMQQMQFMQHQVQQQQLFAQSTQTSGVTQTSGFSIPNVNSTAPGYSSRQIPTAAVLSSSTISPSTTLTDISTALITERNAGVDLAWSLYQGMIFRCTKCAIRFQESNDLNLHANDHFLELKAALVQGMSSRNWYLTESEWEVCRVRHFETMPTNGSIKETSVDDVDKIDRKGQDEKGEKSVRVTDVSTDHPGTCKECGEKLTKLFDDKSEAWIFVGAVFLPPNSLSHVACSKG
jgi:hypothetical protein